MKRLMCLLSAMVLCVSIALASAVDTAGLTHLSDTELIELLEAVNEAVVARGICKTATLPAGRYIAGRDIPVGQYTYTCMAYKDEWGNMTVYSDEGAGKLLTWHVVMETDKGEEPKTYYLSLQEGDELKSDIRFSLTVMPAFRFR